MNLKMKAYTENSLCVIQKKRPDLIKKGYEQWKIMSDYEFYEWNDTEYDITKINT